MALQTSPLVRVSQLSVFYDADQVLGEIDLELFKGTVTALIGPSGSGKSTLLLALTQLLPETARVTGHIHINHSEKPPGIVFQKPLPFRLSIFENVALALREQGVKDPRQRVMEALTLAGLWEEVKDRLHDSALKLSGGQQQRLCLARVLALEPSVLLLDEPCSSLDPFSTHLIEESLKGLVPNTAILIVTHNLAQARRIADHMTVLWPDSRGARVLESGPTEQLFHRSRHAMVRDYLNGYLG